MERESRTVDNASQAAIAPRLGGSGQPLGACRGGVACGRCRLLRQGSKDAGSLGSLVLAGR